MKLSIRRKVSLLVIFTLVLSVVTLAFIAIYNMREQVERDLQTFRDEENQKVRETLEGYVNLAYQSVETNYRNLESKEYIQKIYGHRLTNVIDVAESILRAKATKVREGQLSLAEAQQQALAEIQAIRYDNGSGYVWVNDATLPYPSMILHPMQPDLNGQLLSDPKYNCAMGKDQNLFQAMVEVCKTSGRGFVDYKWPKPGAGGMAATVQKLSYVSLFADWGWIIGTGVYMDDVRADIMQKTLKEVADLRYDGDKGYFWINNDQQPYPLMVMHPVKPELNNKPLDDAKFNCVKGTNQNFYQAMVEVAKSKGSGFVEYMWQLPESSQPEPKLSYVRHFQPYGWVIGTGVHTDGIDKMIAARQEEMSGQINTLVLTIVLVSVVLIGAGSVSAFFLAKTMTNAIYQVKDRLQSLALGKSIGRVTVNSKDEIGEMADSLNNLVDGIDSYTVFAREIGKGNLDANFAALSEEDTLGNSLLQMRHDLKQVATEEGIRKWVNEGIAIFSEVLRKYNNDFEGLCLNINSQLVKYMGANQGSFYILESQEGNKQCLELKACFAYDKRKYADQRLAIGEGLAGQAVLEKDYFYLTDIPQGYVRINSGLGEATPNALLVMPLINNDEVLGVFELASFRQYKPYEIEFLQKVAESIASSVSSVKVNEVTRRLLQDTQQMTEEIRAQEEELRQNTEELLATQEEMSRKLREVERENMQLHEQLQLIKEKGTAAAVTK
ncbi:cache domain-containing protein [Cesiribacter sp. SM1]|uniref:cache domain-containing protein n=1 Tax=Cesiribacter sp. SM1 TaxID=2861196 RepID=UPI001CD7A851|nr:cache domain-containing protein [Cesiribacter sp. SM1]